MNLNFLKRLMILSLVVFSCSDDKTPASEEPFTLFNKLDKARTGIEFSNDITEDSVLNYFTYPYLYMGGGVATGDLNKDGLTDIFFTGNQVSNRLYLNRGDLRFEDITDVAGVAGDDRWITGVTMADVNGDGWLDIYVSVSGKFTTTRNLLYVNQGLDDSGMPTFKEMAEQRGIADEGNSTQGTFFDYDKDGDLDLYVANYPLTHFKTPNYSYKIFIDKKDPEKSDRLYQNDGNGFFSDVTKEAGLLNFGLSLSATVADFNNDGWDDLYVSNDFASPDIFYFNNGDGTFFDQLKKATQHTAFFGMGADAGDINNDGLFDLVQMDMTPEDNRRNKANMASMDIAGFWEIVGYGLHHQYMQNVMQINNGVDESGIPHFGDVARMAGMSSTDWSWATLIADLDNDGLKDIFITNGTRRDINNKDYFNSIENASYQEKQQHDRLELAVNIPSEKVANYLYKNQGDLNFESYASEWGVNHEGFSNGASYADLDNDGDLDLIINNIDEEALIFQNLSSDQTDNSFLQIAFEGPSGNPFGIGAKVQVTTGEDIQYFQNIPTRGFQSSVEPRLTIGLGASEVVDELLITWPDGSQEVRKNLKGNDKILVNYEEASQITNESIASGESRLFSEVTDDLNIEYRHKENPFNDYEYELLLPHQYSRNGPGLAVGDVNGDGLEDFFVGGASGKGAVLFLQSSSGEFMSTGSDFFKDRLYEDLGATFFDADGDLDLDLYVVSGGNDFKNGSDIYQDRLYINDGKGNFEKSDGLPTMYASGSRVRPGDVDGDGDLDLFVGGRVVPQSYPSPAPSFILENVSENGVVKFEDATNKWAGGLSEAGLVTDAAWVDYNNDEALDLIVVGEWMPITIYENTGEELVDRTEYYGLSETVGWWYSLASEDLDNDGDMDLVAGNLGLNYKYQASAEETFDVYLNDYDKNGTQDIVLGYYNSGQQYPLRGRQCSSEQIPAIKYKYEDYNSFASATLIDVYSEADLESSLHYQAKTFASTLILNQGDGFEMKALPNQVQISAINDILIRDFDGDGNHDLLVAGNMYSAEVETTRNDASYGKFLKGDGQGGFEPIPYSSSGFFIKGDTKDLDLVETDKGPVIIAANNSDKLVAHRVRAK